MSDEKSFHGICKALTMAGRSLSEDYRIRLTLNGFGRSGDPALFWQYP